MKKLLLGTVLSTVLLLTACGDDEPAAEENVEMEEEFNESSAATEEKEDVETVEDSKGTRSNPYQIGETAEITVTDMDEDYNDLEGKALVTIDNVLRGEEALSRLNGDGSAGTHAQPDEEGLEWITFDVTFELQEYVDDDTSYVVKNNFNIFNENGEQVSTMIAAMDNADGNSVFQGGALERAEAYTAPVEGSFLLQYSDAEEEIFFEVK